MNSLNKLNIFKLIVKTLERVQPICYKCIFVIKRNGRNEILKYKARLVAHGFSQRHEVDFNKMYASMMDTVAFQFFLLVLAKKSICLMDVKNAYLYNSLDIDNFVKLTEGLKFSKLKNLVNRIQ